MQTLTSIIIDAGLANRLVTDDQLRRLVAGSDQRRYHLTNRAMKAGELWRIRRGLYLLEPRFRTTLVQPYAIAQAVEPGSYVSCQTALSHHNWTPEAVYVITSVAPGRRKRDFEHERFGRFTFRPVATRPWCFLDGVDYFEADGEGYLLATPLRALCDLIYLEKAEWQGMGWLEAGLRIDPSVWRDVTGAQFRMLADTFRDARVRTFLQELQLALGLGLSHE